MSGLDMNRGSSAKHPNVVAETLTRNARRLRRPGCLTALLYFTWGADRPVRLVRDRPSWLHSNKASDGGVGRVTAIHALSFSEKQINGGIDQRVECKRDDLRRLLTVSCLSTQHRRVFGTGSQCGTHRRLRQWPDNTYYMDTVHSLVSRLRWGFVTDRGRSRGPEGTASKERETRLTPSGKSSPSGVTAPSPRSTERLWQRWRREFRQVSRWSRCECVNRPVSDPFPDVLLLDDADGPTSTTQNWPTT